MSNARFADDFFPVPMIGCVCDRTENLTEMDLFIESHKYFLANKTKSEIFYPHNKDGIQVRLCECVRIPN